MPYIFSQSGDFIIFQETSELEVVTALQKDLENARMKITELEASLKQKQDEIAKVCTRVISSYLF